MPRTELTVTTSTHDGVAITEQASDPTNDHEIADNDGYVAILAVNLSASVRTLIIDAAATFGSPAIPLVDRTITLAATGGAGDRKVIGPFSKRLFNQVGDHSDQSVLIDVDGSAADVDFYVFNVPIAVT